MKKAYHPMELNFVEFDENDVVITSGTCTCNSVCVADGTPDCPPDNECKFCNYLVCTPVDVIIG